MTQVQQQTNRDCNKKLGRGYPDLAYEFIKERILTLAYRPGQSLSEAEIAKELGVSRTPVREAINRLCAAGLVTSNPNQGKVVYALSLKDIQEIFDIKECLEGLVAKQAALNRTEAQVKELRQIVESMQDATKKKDLGEWLEADKRYHNVLFEAAGNERACQLISNLNEQWQRIRVGFIALEGRIGSSTQEHIRMVQLIDEQEGEQAARTMQEHLHGVRTALTSLIKHFVVPYIGEKL